MAWSVVISSPRGRTEGKTERKPRGVVKVDCSKLNTEGVSERFDVLVMEMYAPSLESIGFGEAKRGRVRD